MAQSKRVPLSTRAAGEEGRVRGVLPQTPLYGFHSAAATHASSTTKWGRLGGGLSASLRLAAMWRERSPLLQAPRRRLDPHLDPPPLRGGGSRRLERSSG